MYDCISLTDISKELVTESFAFACTLYKACDINDVASSGNNAVWVYQFGKFV